jgi:hypothetical protein
MPLPLEHASTGRRYSVARGAVAFLLFLLPKPSDEAEQRQQMVPRALRSFAGLAPQLREAFVDLWLSAMFA